MIPIDSHPYVIGDGENKVLKPECKGCDCYIEIEDKELCGVGKEYKYLTSPMRRIKCTTKDKLWIKEKSIKYLTKIKNGGPVIDGTQLKLAI